MEETAIVHLIVRLLAFCDISELNECESDPCENGGTCEDEINAYTCVCAPGYNGTQCEIGELNLTCFT